MLVTDRIDTCRNSPAFVGDCPAERERLLCQRRSGELVAQRGKRRFIKVQHAVFHGSSGEAGGLVSGGFVRGDAFQGGERNGDHGFKVRRARQCRPG